MSTLYSIGAVNQLADSLEKAGYSPEDLTKLKQFNNLKGFKDVLNGKAVISYQKNLVDMRAQPFVPGGWTVEQHIAGSENFELDMSKLSLYLSDKQKGGYIEGVELRKELKGKLVMNANLLDYFLEHQDLIPKDWKGKNIFFWGTIYRNSNGNLCCRYLSWDGSKWDWGYNWFGLHFIASHPAMIAI